MNIKRTAIVVILFILIVVPGCGQKQTSGFFAGFGDSGDAETPVLEEQTETMPEDTATSEIEDAAAAAATVTPRAVLEDTVEDTLVNCTFESVLDSPFGADCSYRIYNNALHIDNSSVYEPVVLLSTGGLLDDGLIEAVFDIQEAPSNSVIGVVISGGSASRFILLGVNSRRQFTVQRMSGGYWIPLMGMEPFESSNLLSPTPATVSISLFVHGSYVDFSVNGQLITVVKTALPLIGQAGVFVDSQVDVDLTRFTVVPAD